MKRRPTPGQLSLFDTPGGMSASVRKTPPPAPPLDPKPMTHDKPRRQSPQIIQPDYMRDGMLYLPKGIVQPPCMANWYCVVSDDGKRDALTVLYRIYNKNDAKELEDISGVLEIPILGKCWEDHGNWLQDVYSPAIDALEAYAAETLGTSILGVKLRHYLVVAHSQEQRFEQRDVPHLGTVRPQVRSEVAA
ncbi:MAG: hypothetical protein AB7D37_05560 [Desulfovibrio sp.]